MEEKQNKDIFDVFMGLSFLRVFYPVYQKHREGLLYLFFGGLTFFLGLAIYMLLIFAFGIHELIANAVSWMIAVLFSFLTTKRWVFRSGLAGIWEFFCKLVSFYVARFVTLLLQELLIYIFVTILDYNSAAIKIATEEINIILNFFVSKFLIFRK